LKKIIVSSAGGSFATKEERISEPRSGWPSGNSKDFEDALKFAVANGIRPMIETFPAGRAAEAYEHMISGKVRFRSVLKI
jgi:D-arabinose 1-dehydrogenase-like Zn-dependent alcohol dehydrogenase